MFINYNNVKIYFLLIDLIYYVVYINIFLGAKCQKKGSSYLFFKKYNYHSKKISFLYFKFKHQIYHYSPLPGFPLLPKRKKKNLYDMNIYINFN